MDNSSTINFSQLQLGTLPKIGNGTPATLQIQAIAMKAIRQIEITAIAVVNLVI
jgi:hypothetical protein